MRRLFKLAVLLCLCNSPAMAQRIVIITGGTVTANVTDSADFYVTLNQNVTGVTLTSTVTPATGYLVSMKFVQDATGSRTVVFGGNISTSCAVNSTANSVTICRWQYTASGNAWADAAGGAAAFPATVSGTVTSGAIPYFSSTTQESSSGILNTNILVKGGGAAGAPTNSSITDDGTTVSTTEAVNIGSSPPACVAGTAGLICMAEGTDATNVSGAGFINPNSTQHEFAAYTNGATGAANQGLLVRTQPGRIHSTANTAAITTATLCASAAGACNTAGLYTVDWAFTQGGTACGTPGAGGVTFLLTWTDANGTAHSAISVSMDDSASLVATTGTFHFTTSNATAWATGSFNLYSNGSIIQYATGYTACGVGTGSYNIDIVVTRKGQT